MSDFGAELSRAGVARGMTMSEVARAAGFTPSYVHGLRIGKGTPSIEAAIRLASALDWPVLSAMVRSARTYSCVLCGKRGVAMGRGTPKKFCSLQCFYTERKRKDAPRIKNRQWVVGRRLKEHQAAVARFCRACEPDGACRDSGCQLRPVSPLPFLARSA